MTTNPMAPMRELRRALIDQIGRSFFGFAPNGRPEQQPCYAALRTHLVALVLDGHADDVMLERPGITACAFFEHVRMARPEVAELATRLASASQRTPAASDLARSSE